MLPGRSRIALLLLGLTLGSAHVAAQELPENFLRSLRYREIGPTRQGGRIVAIAVSQQNPKVFFVGAGPGGMWKTTNGGHSFTSVFDHEGTSSIGHVAIAPSDDGVVWVGTGEANLRNSTYHGDGVYKSVDGGTTWNNMGLGASQQIGKVVIDPRSPDVVYVAAQGKYYADSPERGVFKTIDGGLTWTKSLAVTADDGRGRRAACRRYRPGHGPARSRHALCEQLSTNPTPVGVSPVQARAAASTRPPTAGRRGTSCGAGYPWGTSVESASRSIRRIPRTLYAIVEDANSPGVSLEDRASEIARRHAGKQGHDRQHSLSHR